MEQLIVTPLKSYEFIIGKTIPYILLSLGQMVAVIILAIFWFEIPLNGSILLLFLATCLFLLSTLGIGLFISTIAATQQEAMMSVFLFYMPTFLLSGFAYPIANMPQIIQWFTLINPMRYYLIIIRGIFLKGVGMNILWINFLPLLAIGFLVITMSTLRFRKKIA